MKKIFTKEKSFTKEIERFLEKDEKTTISVK